MSTYGGGIEQHARKRPCPAIWRRLARYRPQGTRSGLSRIQFSTKSDKRQIAAHKTFPHNPRVVGASPRFGEPIGARSAQMDSRAALLKETPDESAADAARERFCRIPQSQSKSRPR